MFPFPRRKELNLAIYSSFFLEKTANEQIFYIALLFRTLIVFRVSKLYLVNANNRLYSKLKKLAKYALSPPYLKREIPLDKDLSKVGLLPPMNMQSHIVHKFLVEGEIRIGKKGNFGIKELEIPYAKFDSILITDSINRKFIKYPKIYYNGFTVHKITLQDLLKKENLIIGSRSGKDPFKYKSEIQEIYDKMGLTLLIGPPEGNLLRSIKCERCIKFAYNFVPKQGVSDVRVEEAIISALSILNFILQ